MVKQNDNYKEWWTWGYVYLRHAYYACQGLYSRAEESSQLFLKARFIIPIVYDFKHAVELNIKSFALVLFDNFETGHDIKNLFISLQSKLPIKKDVELQALTEKIMKIIIKYADGGYLGGLKKNIDKFNTAERYPNSLDSYVVYKHFEVLDKQQKKEDILQTINVLGTDIEDIQNCFAELLLLVLSKYKIQNRKLLLKTKSPSAR